MSIDENLEFPAPDSGDEDIVEYSNVTVKFQLSDAQTVAQVYPNCLTIGEIKKDIGKKFEVDPKYLSVSQFGNEIPNSLKLLNLEKNDFGIIEVWLRILDKITRNGKIPELNLQAYYDKSRLADFITVRIPSTETEDGLDKDIVVEIQNQSINKPYLGGFKNIKTGIEYLDAYTQTGPPMERMKFDGFVSRNCQTIDLRTKAIDTVQSHSTQSFGNATKLIHVENSGDRIIAPKRYQSYAERRRHEQKIAKVKLIQRNFRRYLWQRLIKNAAAQYRHMLSVQKSRETKRIEAEANRYTRECTVKAFPRSKEDFDLLFAQVQRWKESQIRNISNTFSGASRIAEMTSLLDKEVKLLNGIAQQRNLVRKALRDFRNEQLLNSLGEPVKWIGYKSMVVEMDLLRTQRVRYLTEYYKKLGKKLKKESRIELINQISSILRKEAHSSVIGHLLDLFDREKNLLMYCKMCEKDLETLRKRQLILFVEIIKDERNFKPKKAETRMCGTCKKVKPMSEFALRTRQYEVEVCKSCFDLKRAASDNSIFKAILRSIQRDERKKSTLASFAFIMQEDDIRFIVENIWHGHSLLSQCNAVADLRLPRWIESNDWSPWNCVCLSKAEERLHKNVVRLEDRYDSQLIQDVQSKHMLAKDAFKKLQDVEHEFNENGDWCTVGIKDKVL